MKNEISCNLCGSYHSTLLHSTRDIAHNLEGSFNYVQCNECGLVYLTPRPDRDEISRYYPEDYQPFKRAIDDEPFFLMRYMRRRKIKARCSLVHKFKTEGRILDVGCATGIFLAEMRRYPGWEVIGLEPNQEAAEYAQARLGLTVFNGALDDAEFPSSHFDVITFWDVFEHLLDPSAVLVEIRRILKPDGLLVLSLPDLDSFDARLFRKYWIGFDAPRHFYVFSVQTLNRALAKGGFEIIAKDHFEGGYFAFVASLGLLINEKISSERGRKTIRKILYMPGARFFLEPFFSVLKRIGKGTVLTVCARKSTAVV